MKNCRIRINRCWRVFMLAVFFVVMMHADSSLSAEADSAKGKKGAPLPVFIVAGQSNAVRLGSIVKDGGKKRQAGAKVYCYINSRILKSNMAEKVETKVKALDIGIDDYLTKPFDMDELLARVRALIRRGRAAGELPAEELVSVAGGELDLDGLAFTNALGAVQHLSEREAAVLALFARNPGRTLTRSEVLEEAWGLDSDPTERTVDNFVLRLRRLVESDPDHPRHLTTVRGKGYRWEP